MSSGRGGQDNEIGSEYRARVGALLATAVLLGDDVENTGAPISGVPVSISAEADRPVDDLVLRFDDSTTACIQAKHRVGLETRLETPFGKAMRQFVADHRAGDKAGTAPLVLAYARGSRPVEDLDSWCRKLRFAEDGVPSPRESDASESLRKLLLHLDVDDDDDVLALCRRMHFWNTDPRDGDPKAVVLQRLKDLGVPAAQAVGAYGDLATRIRVLAQFRAGDDQAGLIALLRRRGHLDLAGGQSRSVRRALLLQAYRERTVQQGRNLAVYAVPAAVAQIPLSEGDAIVRVELPPLPDKKSGGERSLGLALRRRGRVIVIGDGGSGKSTALRVLAAELAADPTSSPLPLSAHCQEVLEHGNDPLVAAIANATNQLPPDDAALLEETFRRSFARGETALLLDGLDEVVGPARLASTFRSWLDAAPSSTEVVLATRPSALQAAVALDWPRLQLTKPQNSTATVEAVVKAVGAHRGQNEAWVDERVRWVSDRLDRDGGLPDTPLIVVLLATLAATADDVDDLPESRPAVLWRVLHEVMTEWEVGTRRRGHLQVGQFSQSEAERALQRALFVLAQASVLPAAADYRRALADDFVAQFGDLAPARLDACVDDATQFWMASGLFTETGGKLRAHPRTLAEAALAWQAVHESAHLDKVLELRADPSSWAVLAMIAGERTDVREVWARLVAQDGDPDELIALVNAHLGGMTLTQVEIENLCGSPTLSEALAKDREPDRVVEALLALHPGPAVVTTLRRAVAAALPLDEHAALDAALLLQSDAITDSDAARLKSFFMAPRPHSGPGEDGVYRIDSLDNLSLRTLQDIAIWLAQRSRTDAELVIQHLEQLRTTRFLRRLSTTLLATGHEDLAEQSRAAPLDYKFDFSGFGDYRQAVRTALTISAGAGQARPLSRDERRRLDELADLWSSMKSNWWDTRWVERRPEVLKRYHDLAIVLGGFEAEAVAAEAQQVLNELGRDPDADDVLTDEPSPRRLTRWELIDDAERTVDDIVEIFGLVPYQCLPPLFDALAHAPCREHTFDALVAALPSLMEYWRKEASLLALALTPDTVGLAAEWSASDDVRRRQAAAFAVGFLLTTKAEAAESLALALIDDTDRGVQADALTEIANAIEKGTPLGPKLREALERLNEKPLSPYKCLWCGTLVPDGQRSCPRCRSSGPEFGEDFDRALGRVRARASGMDILASLIRSAPPNRIRRSSILE